MKIRIISQIPIGNCMAAGQTAVYPRGGATTPVSPMWSAAGPQAGHQRPEAAMQMSISARRAV
mgnify:CR=1 FL=1